MVARRFVYGWIVLLALTVEVPSTPSAQAPLLPAATLQVNAGWQNQVWPADFDEDGITDLASATLGTNGIYRAQIAIGRGDGTFAAPVVSTATGWVAAAADLNRDGFIDAITADENRVRVARGNGDGTLQAGVSVFLNEGGPVEWVLAVDLDADNIRDLVTPTYDYEHNRFVLALLKGRGDLTFDPPVSIETDAWPRQGTAGDFNGDGLIDLATAHTAAPRLDVYLNQGNLYFTRTSQAVSPLPTDLTTRDLNGDGRLDIVMSAASDTSYFFDGVALVFTGGGDGTFTPAGSYPTAIGPIAVVIGDFTQDGRLDIATANRSFRIIDDCAWIRGSDSVSVIPGNGDGTFGSTTSFALSSQAPGAPVYGDEVDSLNTADLNRDGRTDLIASDGRLLLTAAPRANRPPVAIAGDDVVEPGSSTIFLRGGGSDPDGHLLSFRFRNASGTIDVASAVGCVENLPPERYELTLTADDGRAQATDGVVYDFRYVDPGPPGWTADDIGAVGASGSAIFNPQENEYTVTGSGADVWDRADEFHFVHTAMSGDATIYAKVSSIENVNRWTKAGVMIREGLAPGARHASLFVTPTTEKGIAFQRRTTVNGLSVHSAGPALTTPVWVMLRRAGDLISAYYRRDTDVGWILVGRETLPGLASSIEVGLAVSSHVDGTLATARFNDVLAFNSEWGSGISDIGAVGVPFQFSSATPGQAVLQASGADIWGTADAFAFHRTWWTADGTLTAHVQSIEAVNPWSKIGVMFRETASPSSKHVMLIVSPGKGIAMQYRAQTGGISANVAITPGTAPEWLRIRRSGNTFTGYASEDGATWRTIGSVTVPMDLDAFPGVAVTSHDNTRLATGVYDSFTIVR